MIALPAAFLECPIAHRALHGLGRPENSLAAVKAAVASGYGIEIDIRLSADRVAMVFHDETLDRVTSAVGPVLDRTSDTLGEIVLSGGDGSGVPTLSNVLANVDGAVPLLIEIKDQDGALGPNVGPLEEAVVAALAGYQGPVALMSFNPYSVAHLAKIAPDIPRGLTTDPFLPQLWPGVPETMLAMHREMTQLDAVGASFISHNHWDLASRHVARVKERGLRVLCWTIRSSEAEGRARRVADNVTFEGYTP